MNKSILIGRLTRDPELKTTNSQVAVCSFSIAVDRKFKNANGDREADFIGCVAWRQTAEFIAKYFRKGSKICVEGSLQSRSWDDAEGKRHSVIEVVVDQAEFVEAKDSSAQARPATAADAAAFDDSAPLPFDI